MRIEDFGFCTGGVLGLRTISVALHLKYCVLLAVHFV